MSKKLVLPENYEEYGLEILSYGNTKAKLPDTPGFEGSFDRSRMEDVGVSVQGAVTNWRNNLSQHIDEIHKSELTGEQVLLMKELDDIQKDTNLTDAQKDQKRNYIMSKVQNLEVKKLKYDEEIENSPVSKSYSAYLQSIAMTEGSAAMFTKNWINQLSEDLAGTLMYQVPQTAIMLGSYATKFVPVVGVPLGLAVDLAATSYFRHKESLAELGDAYENRMAEWEDQYLQNNPIETEEQAAQFLKDKQAAEIVARSGAQSLYNKNMALMAQDYVSAQLMIGRFGRLSNLKVLGKGLNTGTRAWKAGKYALANGLNSYYGEGLIEEGSQYNWQKQFAEGKLDGRNSIIGDIYDAGTEDLGEVISAHFPKLLKPEDLSLTLDPDFHDAVNRGGKAAMVFGMFGLGFNTAVNQYKYSQVKRKLSNSVDLLKEKESNEYNKLLYDLYDSGKLGEAAEAADRLKDKGLITQEDYDSLLKDFEKKGTEYEKIHSPWFSGFRSSFDNSKDEDTKLDAWLTASRIIDLKKELEDFQGKKEEIAEKLTVAGVDVSSPIGENYIQSREEDIKNRIKAAEDRLKKIATGGIRSIQKQYESAVKEAGKITDQAQRDAAIAKAELTRTIERRVMNLDRYGNHEKNRQVINNINVIEQLAKNPTVEKAVELIELLKATRTTAVKETIDAINNIIQPAIDRYQNLQEEANHLSEELDNNTELYEAGNEKKKKKYEDKLAEINKELSKTKELELLKDSYGTIRHKDKYEIYINGQKREIPLINGKPSNEVMDQLTPQERFEATTQMNLVDSFMKENDLKKEQAILENLTEVAATADAAATNPNFSNINAVRNSIAKLNVLKEYMKDQDFKGKERIQKFVDYLDKTLSSNEKKVETLANSNIRKSEENLSEMTARMDSVSNEMKDILEASVDPVVKELLAKKDKGFFDYLRILYHLTDAERKAIVKQAIAKYEFAKQDYLKLDKHLGTQLERATGKGNYTISYNLGNVIAFATPVRDPQALLEAGYNMSEIIRMVESGKITLENKAQKELALKQLAILKQMRELEDIIWYASAPKIDVDVVISGIQKVVDTSTIIPNGQQLEVMIRLFYKLKDKGNSTFLSGYAGSGKTVTIGNVIRMLGLKDEEVVVTAKIEKIRAALKEKTGVTSSPFNNIPTASPVKLIVIDEAAYLTKEDIEYVEKLKEQNPELNIMFVGDPNQLNENMEFSSAIIDKMKEDNSSIEGLPILNIVNRTNIIPLRDYQSRFIGYKPLRTAVNGVSNIDNIASGAKLEGVLVKTLAEAGIMFREGKITPNSIVVTDKKNFERAVKEFGKDNVFLAHEVQGMEYDTVYVYFPDIPSEQNPLGGIMYNRQLYVASTRAKSAVVHISDGQDKNIKTNGVTKAEDYKKDEAKKSIKAFVDKGKSTKTAPNQQQKAEAVAGEAVETGSTVAEATSVTPEASTEKPSEPTGVVESEPIPSGDGKPVDTKDDGPALSDATRTKFEKGNANSAQATNQKADIARLNETVINGGKGNEKPELSPAKKYVPGQSLESIPEGSVRLELSFSATIRLYAAEIVSLLNKNNKVKGQLRVTKVVKDGGGSYVNIDVTYNGRKMGGIRYLPKEERDAAVNNPDSLYDAMHKSINEHVDTIYDGLEDNKEMLVGEVEIAAVTRIKNVFNNTPAALTKSYIDSMITQIERELFSQDTNSGGKVLGYVPFISVRNDAACGIPKAIEYVAKKYGSEAARKFKDYVENDERLVKYLDDKTGQPFLVFIAQMPGGAMLPHIVQIQPRKLRKSDKVVKRIEEFLSAADSVQKLHNEIFPEQAANTPNRTAESLYGEIAEAANGGKITNSDTLMKVEEVLDQYYYASRIFINNDETGAKGSVAILAAANAQLRNENNTGFRIGYSDLRKIVEEFDSKEESTFYKPGRKNMDHSDEGKGLYLPIQFTSIENLIKGIENPDSFAEGDPRHGMSNLFTAQVESIQGSNIYVNPKTVEYRDPISVEEGKKADAKKASSPKTSSDIEFDKEDLLKQDSKNLRTRISMEEAVKLMKKYAPWMKEEEMQFASRALVRYITGNKKAWGRYKRNTILLTLLKDNTVFKELVKHEIFHKIFHEALSKEEQESLFKNLAIEYPKTKEMTRLEKEEFLADLFMTYEAKPQSIPQRLISWFKKIARSFAFFRDNFDSVEAVFQAIENQEFKKLSNGNVTRFYKEYIQDFGSAQKLKEVKEKIGLAIAKKNKQLTDAGALFDNKDLIRKVVETYLEEGLRLEAKTMSNIPLTEKEQSTYELLDSLGAIGKEKQLRGLRFIIEELTGVHIKPEKTVEGLPKYTFEAKTKPQDSEDQEDGTPTAEEMELMKEKWSVNDDFVSIDETLTATVKAFVGMIPKLNKKGEVRGLLSGRHAFLIFLNLFENYVRKDGSEYESIETFLKERREKIREKSFLGALDHLLSIVENAKKDSYLPMAKVISAKEVVFSKDGKTIHRVSNEALKSPSNLKRNVTVKKKANETAIQFADRVIATINDTIPTPLTEEQIQYFRENMSQEISRDVINSVITGFHSVAKKLAMIGYDNANSRNKKHKVVEYVHAYENNAIDETAKALQQKETLLPIEDRLKEIQEAYRNVKSFTKDELVALFTKVFKDTPYGDYELNLPEKVSEISQLGVTLLRYIDLYLKGDLNNVSAYTEKIATAVSYYSEENTTSSMNFKGKQYYLYNNGNYVTEIFKRIINKAFKVEGKSFWGYNPLLDTSVFRPELVTHFKLAKKDYDGKMLDNGYEDEYEKDYLNRILNYGFISRIIGNKSSFISWFYSISDKPKTMGMTVQIMHHEKKLDYIKRALDQEAALADRKDIRSDALAKRANAINKNEVVKSGFHSSVNISEYRNANEEQKQQMVKDLLATLEKESSMLKVAMERSGFKFMEGYQAAAATLLRDVDAMEASENFNAAEYLTKELFVQHYISKHFVNQIAIGDINAYKGNVDVIKRMAGPFAPGILPAASEKNPTYRVQVVQDVKYVHTPFNDPANLFEKIHGSEFELTDAQQYRFMSRRDRVDQQMGTSSNLRVQDKPVHFHVDSNGEPFYGKSAVLTITPTISRMFKKAAILERNATEDRRTEEEKKAGKAFRPIDEIIYASGVKVGKPQDEESNSQNGRIANSIYTIDTEYALDLPAEGQRQQMDTTSKVGLSKVVVKPSQLVYLLQNMAEVSQERAQLIYKSIAEFVEERLRKHEQELLKEGVVDKAALSAYVRKMTANDEINAIIYNLFAKENFGEKALNLQGITDKVSQLLLSKMYKDIEEMRFKGMKLQLIASDLFEVYDVVDKDGNVTVKTYNKLNKEQKKEIDFFYEEVEKDPDLERGVKIMKQYKELGRLEEFYKLAPANGFVNIENIRKFEDKLTPRELKYYDEKGYAEVIMPNGYLKALGFKDNQVISDDVFKLAFGFRLPSTDMHSSIAIKLVAVYDEGGTATVAIAPKEIVKFHGSDNDADSLSVLQYEAIIDKDGLHVSDKLKYKKGDAIGFVLGFEEELAELNAAIEKGENVSKLRNAKLELLKNRIVHTFLDVITDPKAKSDMQEPISFDPVYEKKDENQEQVEKDMLDYEERKEAFVNDPTITVFRKLNAISNMVMREAKKSPNNVVVDYEFQNANKSGKQLVGYFANGGKLVYLNIKDGKTKMSKMKSSLKIFGLTVQEFVTHEMLGENAGMKVGLLHDIYVNLATDNAKEQILGNLNIDQNTASVAVLMTRLGVPMVYQALVFLSPAVKALTVAYNNLGTISEGKVKVRGIEVEGFNKDKVAESILTILGATPDVKVENEEQEEQQEVKKEEVKPAEETVKEPEVTLEEAASIMNKDIDSLSLEEIKIAVRVLKMYLKFETKAKAVQTVVTATNGMNNAHKDLNSVDNSLEAFEKIGSESFEFSNDMANVPHIASHMKYLKFIKKVLEEGFLFNQPELRKNINKYVDLFRIDVSDDIAKQQMKSDIEQFIISELPMVQEFKNQEPFKGENNQVVEGFEAFLQRFVQEMIAYKADPKRTPIEKEYLNKLSIADKYIPGKKDGGFKKLTFNGKKLKGNDAYLVNEGIQAIINDAKVPFLNTMKKKLQVYMLLEYGMRIMNNSFTRFMPMEMFTDIVDYLDANGERMVQEFNDMNTYKQQMFGVQYAARHAGKNSRHSGKNQELRKNIDANGNAVISGKHPVIFYYDNVAKDFKVFFAAASTHGVEGLNNKTFMVRTKPVGTNYDAVFTIDPLATAISIGHNGHPVPNQGIVGDTAKGNLNEGETYYRNDEGKRVAIKDLDKARLEVAHDDKKLILKFATPKETSAAKTVAELEKAAELARFCKS
jgi:hypothetical protein